MHEQKIGADSETVNDLILINESLRSEIEMLNEKLRTKNIQAEFIGTLKERL